MALTPWRKLKQEFEIRNPWWTYRKDIVELPGGKRGEYHYVHVKGSSMIIPILDDGRMILVNQYRYLCDRESLEFPCGSVKEHLTYEETAMHELAEETGYQAREMRIVGEFDPYNGVTDEICKIFLARGLTPVEAQHDETEEFEQMRLTPEEFDSNIASG
ncbi:MAG TPA: NUDIX hydrolase, partial [Bacteroidota bacterium]|nr:NUDIX hydrolase [Bacteroidota bacterium]